jgi:VWFA-related protein
LQPNSTVRVENPGGDIFITMSKRQDLELIVDRHSGSGQAVRTDEYQVEQLSGLVKITARPAHSDAGIDIRILLPEGTALRLFSNSGDIEINGAAASVMATTERGNIRLSLPERTDADISLSTIFGTVRSNREIKFTSESDSRSIIGQLGAGGAVLSAHTKSGQIILSTISEGTIATTQPNAGPGVENREAASLPAEERDDFNKPRGLSGRKTENARRTSSSGGSADAEDENVLKIESQLVTINASVSTAAGRPILDLQKEDFTIYDDRVQQEIMHFQSVKTPFNLVLLLDLSGSVRDKIKLIKRAAWKFVQATRPEDKVAVITFTNRARLVSQLTNDRELLHNRIDSIQKPDGGTSFYDALGETLTMLQRNVKGQRNAIVILSDGVDNAIPGVPGEGSEISYEDLYDRIQESDVILFPIYVDTEEEAVDNFGMRAAQAYDIARRRLLEFSEATGGAMFSVDRLEDLDGRYDQVAAELRTIYSLGYYPAAAGNDGSFHRIQVQVSRNDAKVRSRRGYYTKKR